MNEFYIQYHSSVLDRIQYIKSAVLAASCPSSARLLGASLFGQVTSVIKMQPTAGGVCCCSLPRSMPFSDIRKTAQLSIFP